MESLTRWSHHLARAGALFGGVLILLSAFVLGVDVLLRKLLNASVGGADELSGYALAIGSAWAFAFTLLDRAHIRIDSVYALLRPRVCAALDLLGLLLFFLFMAFVTWHGFGVFRISVALGAHSLSPLGTPLVVPQFIWFVGLVEFLLIALLLIVRSAMALARGDLLTVQRLIGSRTVSEEVQEELQDVQRRATS